MLSCWKEFILNSLILLSASFAPKDAVCNRSEEMKPLLVPEYTIEDIYKPATFCPTHILCDKYFEDNKNTIGIVKICENNNVRLKRLKQKEKNIIVKVFNNVREYYALGTGWLPNAADMMELEWDDDLEEEARRFFGICADRFVYQNLTSFGKSNDIFVADMYFNEIRPTIEEPTLLHDTLKATTDQKDFFDPSLIRNYTFDVNYALLTAVAYAKSRFIGCALVHRYRIESKPAAACFLTPSEERFDSQLSYNSLFREGEPCSLCPFGSKCSSKYPYLCRKVPKIRSRSIEKHRNYCRLHKQHALCPTWWNVVSKESCANGEIISMTGQNILKTIRIYNDIRRGVAYGTSDFYKGLPQAADMNILEWDYQLQTASERILSYCTFQEQLPGLLKFGKRGEIEAVKIEFAYNESDGAEKALKALLEEQANLIHQQILDYITEEERLILFTNISYSDSKYNAIISLLLAESKHIGCTEKKSTSNMLSNKVGDVTQLCLVAAPKRTNLLYTSGENCTRCDHFCNDGLCSEDENGNGRHDRYCDNNLKHILCREWDLPEDNLKNCDTKRKVYLEPTDVENILKVYNQFRKTVATNKSQVHINTGTSSVNRIKLEWNQDLQVAAERILHNCLNVNDISGEQLKFGRYRELPGTSFYLSHNGSPSEELMKAYTEEEKKLKDTKNLGIQDNEAALTSLVFSKARYIGCARMTPSITPNDPNQISEVCVFASSEKYESKIATSNTGETNSFNLPTTGLSTSSVNSVSTRYSSEKFGNEDSGASSTPFPNKTTNIMITTRYFSDKFENKTSWGICHVVDGLLLFALSTFLGISFVY